MCISFTDLDLDRQEEITVEAHRLAAENNDRWWTWRAEGFDSYLSEFYATMQAQELSDHVAELRREHPDDAQWLAIADRAEAVRRNG